MKLEVGKYYSKDKAIEEANKHNREFLEPLLEKISIPMDLYYEFSDKDWPEDFPHENGNYLNKCSVCEQMFRGYKRRTVCKSCSNKEF